MKGVATREAPAPEQRIGPQEGPQTDFLQSPADIVIFGGEAGGGKTYGLLLEQGRHLTTDGFFAVILRRNENDIRKPGGLWDESTKTYGRTGLVPLQQPLEWRHPSVNAKVKFGHLQYEDTVYDWDGSQICLLCFDQLEQFTETQFFYMLSRNRSTCGVQPYVRATCNPMPDSWLEKFLEWWIEQDENSPDWGYPIPARAGVVRWFIRLHEAITWFDTREEAEQHAREAGHTEQEAAVMPKSCTFIPSSVHDNKILLKLDPGYLGHLLNLPINQRMRLYGGQGRRGGNWKFTAGAGTFFNRGWFKIVASAPPRHVVRKYVRYWDKAGTDAADNPNSAHTCGTLMGVVGSGPKQQFFIVDVVRGQWSSRYRETVIKQTAEKDKRDYGDVVTWVEQEPGSGGKESAENTKANLAGYSVHIERVTGDKFVRAEPLQSQAEPIKGTQFGNVLLVRGPWNEAWLREIHNVDPKLEDAQPLDQMDSSSGALNKLTSAGHGLAVV